VDAFPTCSGSASLPNWKRNLRILELAQSAYSLYVTQSPQEQTRLVKTLLSNCTFDRGSLGPTYNKPFDLFVTGAETGDWLPRLDSNQQPSG
jgi:hypothetical protein